MKQLILTEIYRAYDTLGGSATPTTPPEACRELRALGAPVSLRSIVASWWDHCLDDDVVLELLRDWNAGRPLFKQVFASGIEERRH